MRKGMWEVARLAFTWRDGENILAPYCSQMEIGNHYWEFEDNIILKDGVPMDIIYLSLIHI